ncbi:hypothetical protein O181_048257 [Austropuccinia psidii MF-1]|uniref:Uncharacterized protein n=1 Tax=Austropuccinia psidii MF-1 TaxID=1389203 RepID=A0A9Q3HLG1_9BASI|nr:hypothetical protein [Austropuccinia psidii MF-1]
MLVILANKHTRNAHLLSDPSDHAARGVTAQDALTRTPLWSTMMKEFPSGNRFWDPKQADGNASGQLALCPQVSIFPPPLQWSLYSSIGENLLSSRWRMAMARGHLSLGQLSPCVVTHGIQTPKKNPPNSSQQESLIPPRPRKQIPWQPTHGPSGT